MRIIYALPLIVPAMLGLDRLRQFAAAADHADGRAAAGDHDRAFGADATAAADVGARAAAAAEFHPNDLAAWSLALLRDRQQSVDLGKRALCRRAAGGDRLGARPVAAAGRRLGLARGPLGLTVRPA